MFPEPTCPECRADLPDKGYRVRAVPRLGGRLRKVCEGCAVAIDGQGRLEVIGRSRDEAAGRRGGRRGRHLAPDNAGTPVRPQDGTRGAAA